MLRRLVLLSDDAAARQAAEASGAACSPLPNQLGRAVLEQLGLAGEGLLPAAELVLVHLGGDLQPDSLAGLLQHVDASVCIAERLYLVLLLRTDEPLERVQRACMGRLPAFLEHLRPAQSCSVPGSGPLDRTMLCIHRLDGVVRRDAAQRCDVAEVASHGARGIIAAESVLSEIAYKLGRAAKFGA